MDPKLTLLQDMYRVSKDKSEPTQSPIDTGHPHPCWVATMCQASSAAAAGMRAGTGKITLTPSWINSLQVIPFYSISRRCKLSKLCRRKGKFTHLLQLRICPVKRYDGLLFFSLFLFWAANETPVKTEKKKWKKRCEWIKQCDSYVGNSLFYLK